ncbi:hypothetical protein LXA47_31480 [Massilia sp. P8910]|uniref:hypothetical protein n=1 Tax=Massilia antarctica TaxID=2765360 RepID=UPI001E2CEADB|nr:hypothetical protein [Massilia antarctica]MCE3608094.1 hypothetical protein [Massilia antarctica]
MNKELLVENFKNRLHGGSRFFLKKISENQWKLESDMCRLSFVFDRHEDDSYMILISDPDSNSVGINSFVLRHLRGARDVLADANSAENQAEIFNRYFADVLKGDFSILSEFEKVKLGFGAFLMKALSLPEGDPIKVKAKEFDISWLEDVKKLS